MPLIEIIIRHYKHFAKRATETGSTMSVFLGGKWRDLQLQNEQLLLQMQKSEAETNALHSRLSDAELQISRLQKELNLVTAQRDEVKRVVLPRMTAELQQSHTDTLEQICEYERMRMLCEDYLAENNWLRGKKDLGNTKNSVLTRQRDTLKRKLDTAEHKVQLLLVSVLVSDKFDFVGISHSVEC